MDRKVRTTCKYQDFLFTEKSRNYSHTLNINFWQKLDDLQKRNQDHQIYVDITVRYEKYLGCYCEVLSIRCRQKSIEESARELYNELFRLYPLEFYPEIDKDQISDKDVHL